MITAEQVKQLREKTGAGMMDCKKVLTETVSIGSDGNPVTKESPQQVMQTRNLTGRDQDIKDVRINIKFDTYGYLDIEEARQGKKGEWAAHDIEVRGRDYNSSQVNEKTSIRTGVADPDRETGTYSSVEKTGLIQDLQMAPV